MADAKHAYQSARFYIRRNAGSWCKAFDMALRNDDYEALPLLNIAERAYTHRHDRDPLRLGGSMIFRKARSKMFCKYDARAAAKKAMAS